MAASQEGERHAQSKRASSPSPLHEVSPAFKTGTN
jgi:hypothetical protein